MVGRAAATYSRATIGFNAAKPNEVFKTARALWHYWLAVGTTLVLISDCVLGFKKKRLYNVYNPNVTLSLTLVDYVVGDHKANRTLFPAL